jgi:hypothetical protein
VLHASAQYMTDYGPARKDDIMFELRVNVSTD